MEVSGVRSSWLTMATKSFLMEWASSAAASARRTRRLARATNQTEAATATTPAIGNARLSHSGIGRHRHPAAEGTRCLMPTSRAPPADGEWWR